ncbi:hypothetical protein MXD61_05200, partial [Frankia sp. AgPm24]|uniref:hypothetical protein n=1 Tax=Frankia sp. AgPm24 TaxID=631128 RepID=UPI00201026A9
MISVLVIPADSARPPHLEVVEPYHEMIMNLCGGDLEPSDYTLSDDGPDKAELWAHPFAIEDSLVNDRANAIIGLLRVGAAPPQAPHNRGAGRTRGAPPPRHPRN